MKLKIKSLGVIKRFIEIKRLKKRNISEQIIDLGYKIEAIEEFYRKYCIIDGDNRNSINAYNIRCYNKMKNDLKKEILLTLYKY